MAEPKQQTDLGTGDIELDIPVRQQSKAWSRWRALGATFIESRIFEISMGLVVVTNTAMIVYETDANARCYPDYAHNLESCPWLSDNIPWLWPAGLGFLVFYTMELALRIYVKRMRFHHAGWNIVDVFIVLVGWLGEAASLFLDHQLFASVSFFRVFRIFRLLRILRIFVAFRELHMLLSSVISTAKTLFWGSCMLFIILALTAIMAVDFVHPVSSALKFEDCDRCSRGYSSVSASTLTFFQQIVAGDSWGLISIPVIESAPATAVLLLSVLVMVSLGSMNLILAVIVERANEAREQDVKERAKEKTAQDEQQKETLRKLCQQLDRNDNGTLSLPELYLAYDRSEGFQDILRSMDIRREELQCIFNVLDNDKSGDISYDEFCEQIHQLRTRETRTMLTFMKLSIQELQDNVRELSADFRGQYGCRGSSRADKTMDEESAPLSLYTMLNSQSALLKQHTDTLSSVEHTLCRVASKGLSDNGVAGGSQQVEPCAEPLPPLAPRSMESVLADLDGLGKFAKELANVEGSIVRSVEGHVSTLRTHAGMLASVSLAMSPPSAASKPGAQTEIPERVGEKVDRLREGMRRELASVLQEIEGKLESSAAILGRNTELLTCLASDMGVQQPAMLPTAKGCRGMQEKCRSAVLNKGSRYSAVPPCNETNPWQLDQTDVEADRQPGRPSDTPPLWPCSVGQRAAPSVLASGGPSPHSRV